MSEIKSTVTVTLGSGEQVVHDAATVDREDDYLVVRSGGAFVAIYAPGTWASATRVAGVPSASHHE